MKLLKGFLISLLFSASVVIAAEGTTTEEPDTSSELLVQVVQEQLTLSHDAIKKATATPPKTANDFYSIQIELNAQAAKQLETLSENNMGKSLNIILNDVLVSSSVVQSPLGKTFVITGLSREQATRLENDVSRARH
ncbi:MAG: hypothetical protein P1U32_09070 [Legionellaceae bacterium]|nr:hypothetical protein [Legionellaceae bacterium]